MALPNPNFDTIASSTIANYRKKLNENLIDKQILFWQLKQRGFVDEDRGGTSIVEPIMYGDNTTVKSYSGYDLIDVTPQEGFTSAQYAWKQLAGSVTISGKEEFENSGDASKIFKLLDAKIRQLEISMKKKLNTMLFGDGTGNSGKDITGLALAVEDGTAWSIYGGIDSSLPEGAFWRNRYINFDGVYGASSKFQDAWGPSTKGVSALRTMFNSVSADGTAPTLIVTTQDIYEMYEAVMEGSKQRMVDTKTADAGFRHILYKDVPLVYDQDMDSEGVLFLNSNYLKFTIGKGRNFVTSPFVKPPNQDAKVSNTLLTAQLVMTRRDVHGRITGVSTV